MNIKRIGMDLAKQVFQLYGVDQQEKAPVRKQLRRNQMLGFFSKQRGWNRWSDNETPSGFIMVISQADRISWLSIVR